MGVEDIRIPLEPAHLGCVKSVRRDLRTSKEILKTDNQKRLTVDHDTGVVPEICGRCQKRPTHIKRDLHTSKETYTHQKRPTHIKRDLPTSKETYTHQKRPTHIKRDLHTSNETPKTDKGKRPTVNRDRVVVSGVCD